jgi:hypothetical protein
MTLKRTGFKNKIGVCSDFNESYPSNTATKV